MQPTPQLEFEHLGSHYSLVQGAGQLIVLQEPWEQLVWVQFLTSQASLVTEPQTIEQSIWVHLGPSHLDVMHSSLQGDWQVELEQLW
jgi:hypothetical protein